MTGGSIFVVDDWYIQLMFRARNFLVIMVAAASVSISGCGLLPAAQERLSDASAEEDRQAAAEKAAADHVTQEKMRDARACADFRSVMLARDDNREDTPTAEVLAESYEDLAYALSDVAFAASESGEVGPSIIALSSIAADMSDDIGAGLGVSTRLYLSYRTAIKTLGEICDIEFTFED